jgi:hypothetical protein
VNPNREFFRVSIAAAVETVWQAADSFIPARARRVVKEDRTSDRAPSQVLPTNCPSCRARLRFSPLTGPIGGFCSCGEYVKHVSGQLLGQNDDPRGRGVVLPACGICRNPMKLGRDGAVRCVGPRCGHSYRSPWRMF